MFWVSFNYFYSKVPCDFSLWPLGYLVSSMVVKFQISHYYWFLIKYQMVVLEHAQYEWLWSLEIYLILFLAQHMVNISQCSIHIWEKFHILLLLISFCVNIHKVNLIDSVVQFFILIDFLSTCSINYLLMKVKASNYNCGFFYIFFTLFLPIFCFMYFRTAVLYATHNYIVIIVVNIAIVIRC